MGSGIRDMGSGKWDPGYGIQDVGCAIREMGSRIWDPGYEIWDPGYGIRNMRSGIWDPGYEINDKKNSESRKLRSFWCQLTPTRNDDHCVSLRTNCRVCARAVLLVRIFSPRKFNRRAGNNCFHRMAIVLSTTKMSRLYNVLFSQIRYYRGQIPPKPWKNDAVKYGLVTYYPRRPDHKDPPVTPTKLLMIQRVKHYKGNPWWHKKILDIMDLNDKDSDIKIVKNTPEICALLWKIKHLIKVVPINTPDKLPEPDEVSTYLHENGDLLIAPRIDPAREQATKEFINYSKRMDRPYLNDVLRRRWLQGWDY